MRRNEAGAERHEDIIDVIQRRTDLHLSAARQMVDDLGDEVRRGKPLKRLMDLISDADKEISSAWTLSKVSYELSSVAGRDIRAAFLVARQDSEQAHELDLRVRWAAYSIAKAIEIEGLT
jgi:hypothetical protein